MRAGNDLIVFDYMNIHDKLGYKPVGHVTIKIPGTDIVLFKGYNKVILPGSGFTARCHFDLPRDEITPSYNTKLGLENTVNEAPSASTKEKVYLFCVGTDGCGTENSDIYTVNYNKWLAPDDMVPFRYVPVAEDISADDRTIYYGRLVKNGMVSYYFKTFENSIPTLHQKYSDGTVVTSNVYDLNKTDEISTYVELKLKVGEDDCKEWFNSTVGINNAKINTICLCTAWPKVINGQIYYQDIRPLTKYNMSNENLIELSKGLDITYHIYY